jgi:RNA polymerase sigma-70 factor (ECF subfamily)
VQNRQINDIVKGCLKGDAKSQEALYNMFASKMMAVCRRYVRTDFEAEDVFHDAFVKVFTKLAQYKGEVPLEAWVRRIVVNTSITHYHKYKNDREQVDIDDIFDEPAQLGDILQQLSTEEIIEAVKTLPDGYRQVFNLYVIEGYNHQEIGSMLGIAEGTSKSQLHKARELLKLKLNYLFATAHAG